MRELLADGIERFGRWLWGVDQLPLREGEHSITHGVASYLEGFLPKRGLFDLTNMRLIYIPVRRRWIPHIFARQPVIEIELTDIVAITRGSWLRALWSDYPGGRPIMVHLRDGSVRGFQAWGQTTWRREISKAAGLDDKA